MPRYSDEVKAKALRLFMDHMSYDSISELPEMPTKRTLINWSQDGVLTEGVTWTEYRDRQEELQLVRVENDQMTSERDRAEEFWEEAIPELRETFWSVLKRIKDGKAKIKAGDIKTIVSVLRRLENRGRELKQFQEEFMRLVMFAAREVVDDEHTFNLLVEKMKHVQNRQLTKMDPDNVLPQ